jgi:S1-C subfamily serine protease
MEAGDVITAVNGEAVEDFDAMLTLFERYRAGDRVTLTLWRSGKTRQQTVVLGASE